MDLTTLIEYTTQYPDARMIKAAIEIAYTQGYDRGASDTLEQMEIRREPGDWLVI